jgi:outer membrane cobalamin receptor
VRRSGGLGSGDRLSLNGLEGERIRIFVDGLPIAASAYNNGVANIPVNLIERVRLSSRLRPVHREELREGGTGPS